MSDSINRSSQSVTETPWFWLMLFSCAALAAIATIGPKFERREQVIETKFHARERGLHREPSGPGDDVELAEAPQWNPIFTLGPIVAVIGLVAIVSFVGVIRFQRRQMKGVFSDSSAKSQAGSNIQSTGH